MHSYYAGMGGFAIQIDDSIGNFLPLESFEREKRFTRLTLTPEGLVFLEEHSRGFIPDQSRTEIEDRSKGSMFAKSLVCFQGWLPHGRFRAFLQLCRRQKSSKF